MPLRKWTDDHGLDSGEHAGALGLIIFVKGKNFDMCGIREGLAVKNVTLDWTGLVTSPVTAETIPTNVPFRTGDEFIVYCTGTVDKVLSSFGVDRMYGDFVKSKDELDADGYLPKWREDLVIKSSGASPSPDEEDGIRDADGDVIHGSDGEAIVGA